MTGSLANRINSELGFAIIGTRSTGETTGQVAALLKTGGRSRALTLIRTELGRAYSAGQQRMEQASEVLPGLRKQWRRSGKLRAHLTHDAIDGQLRDADKPFSVAGASLMFPRDPSRGPPPRPSTAAANRSPGWRAGRSATLGVDPPRPRRLRAAAGCIGGFATFVRGLRRGYRA